MKKIIKRLKRSNWLARYFYYILLVCYLIGYIFFTKSLLTLNGIETVLRIILIIVFLLWLLFYAFYNFLNLLIRKYKRIVLTSLVTTIFIAIFFVSSYYINIIFGGLNNIVDTNKTEYISYLIKLKDNEFNEESEIGRISNEDDIEGYKLTKNIISKYNLTNHITNFDDYDDMLFTLYEKKVDAVFVPSNYLSLFRGIDGLENIEEETEIIYQYKEKNTEKKNNIGSNKDFSEPLTFLLMGVDSTKDGLDPNAGFNGDTLMLITFNPKTLETLMVSVPRDTYVPITCNNNRYAKINSSAAYGSDCVINTVGKLLDTTIDYYVKINFKGVVKLVDALKGVEVDVEAPTYGANKYNGQMCEQNSNREFGDQLICLKPGKQILNGEEALAYSRNRHLYIGGDFDRIRHQQQVVEAIAKKMLNFSSLKDFEKIFNAISNNIATNMENNKILTGYSVMKDMALKALNGEEFININKGTLETYSLPVYLPNSGTTTSAQGYYQDSLQDIRAKIKEILGQKSVKPITTFNFSVNEEYEKVMPGKGLKKEKSLVLMPNLIGSDISKAEELCNEYNIKLNKVYVDPGAAHYNGSVGVGLIGDQDIHINTLLNNVSTLTIYIPNAVSSEPNNKVEDKTKDETDNKTDNKIEDVLDNFNVF